MSDGNETTSADFPVAGNEVQSLVGCLDRIRGTFAWKCGGLDTAEMRVTLGPSSVTLGGLLKHLAACEDYKFTVGLHGREMPEPFRSADWDADPDWEWHSAAEDYPEELMALWQASVNRSRAAVAEALADGGLDTLVKSSQWDEPPNLRRLMVDMIEEYARHTGHADLIRESIVGLVGEDPPQP